MYIATKLDEGGRFAWTATMIAGFIIFWPIGLAVLAYMIWSGRMGCRNYAFGSEMRDEWRSHREEWRARKRELREKFRAERHRFTRGSTSSGNSAFDDYKAETLKRLENEQAEFNEFLDNLRRSRDKAEFDQFMQSRKAAPEPENREVDQFRGDSWPQS
jgi:hypothetical protein